jgi:dehydrogenase/reductase SDR family member 7B
MNSLKSKIIWITGASSGIGEACAYKFAKDGAKLILTALETDLLEKVKKSCLDLGAECEIIAYDLSNIADIPRLCKKAISLYGTIDILFNNAGISQRALAGDIKFEVEQKLFDINYFSPVLITKTILDSMIKNGGGTIVVTTSIAGKFGFPLRSSYCASKHALYGYFESLHAEYFDKNIRVCFICPGRVNTNISVNAVKEDGKNHGQLDPGQASGISKEKAAIIIYNSIIKQKAETLIGGKELIMVYIKRFLPALCRKLARKIKST